MKFVFRFFVVAIAFRILLFFMVWVYTSPYYFGSLLSIHYKRGVDTVIGSIYTVKNAIFRTSQPIPWYPKHVTIEDIAHNNNMKYSLYGYISSVRTFQNNVGFDLQTQYGTFPFEVQTITKLPELKKINGVTILSEQYVTPLEFSYNIESNNGKLQEVITFVEGDFLPIERLCTGELVKIEWTDSRTVDELSNENGEPTSRVYSKKFVSNVVITIMKNKYAVKENKNDLIQKCRGEKQAI